MQPQRRQWYDRLADSILGDDDPNIASPSSRYALICEKCFTHNGLVKESMWEDARKLFNLFFTVILGINFFIFFIKEYVCPKCNHFNKSARSKRSRQQQNDSPNPSATSSPQTPASITSLRQPSLLQSPQESDLPNVDLMEVDTEVDAST